jgi:hypothetical protein
MSDGRLEKKKRSGQTKENRIKPLSGKDTHFDFNAS